MRLAAVRRRSCGGELRDSQAGVLAQSCERDRTVIGTGPCALQQRLGRIKRPRPKCRISLRNRMIAKSFSGTGAPRRSWSARAVSAIRVVLNRTRTMPPAQLSPGRCAVTRISLRAVRTSKLSRDRVSWRQNATKLGLGEFALARLFGAAGARGTPARAWPRACRDSRRTKTSVRGGRQPGWPSLVRPDPLSCPGAGRRHGG